MDRTLKMPAPGDRLPDLSLPSAPDGAPVPLRAPGRRATVVVRVHAADCAGCRAYLAGLSGAAAEIAEWDGRVVAAVPGGVAEAERLRSAADLPFPVLAEAEGRWAGAVGAAEPGVLIADQWGVLHLRQAAGADHALPSPEEVAQWLRFLAVHCPECEGEAW